MDPIFVPLNHAPYSGGGVIIFKKMDFERYDNPNQVYQFSFTHDFFSDSSDNFFFYLVKWKRGPLYSNLNAIALHVLDLNMPYVNAFALHRSDLNMPYANAFASHGLHLRMPYVNVYN